MLATLCTSDHEVSLRVIPINHSNSPSSVAKSPKKLRIEAREPKEPIIAPEDPHQKHDQFVSVGWQRASETIQQIPPSATSTAEKVHREQDQELYNNQSVNSEDPEEPRSISLPSTSLLIFQFALSHSELQVPHPTRPSRLTLLISTMNLRTLFAVAAVAMVGSVVSADEDCTTSQQTTAFTALASLLAGTDLTDCSTASGYNMLYATALPTTDETAKMCAVTSCHSLIATVISKNPPNCILTIPTSGAKMNVYTLATTFEVDCTALSTPAATTATPAATTATPAATTATPSATTATPSTTTETPATTTATPTVASSTSGSSSAATPVASSSTGSKAAC